MTEHYERRTHDRCPFCNGKEIDMQFRGKLLRVCLICGKEHPAQRESDRAEFQKKVDSWQ